MMTDREKLVGLVKEICNTVVKACGCSDMLPTYSFCKNAVYESIADYLITNGVTVQEWIPLAKQKPGENEQVLVFFEGMRGTSAETQIIHGWVIDGSATHWMSKPEPPKEE